MDQIYLASQFLYTATERFRGAANALLCADEDLHPRGAPGDCKGANYALIRQEMRSRGTAGAGIRSRSCCWISIASNMSTIPLAMRLVMRCCAKRPFA